MPRAMHGPTRMGEDRMRWPGAIEHSGLLTTAERLVEELDGLQQRLEHRSEVEYAQHRDFAARARSLADYLRGAMLLAQTDLYAPSFASLRTALEQTLVDRLVFLGRRYVQVVEGVDEATWLEWERQRSAGEAFTTVINWTRTKRGLVEITHEGLRSNSTDGEDDYLLSVHYFLLRQYQPYLGPPSAQRQFDDGLSGEDRYRKYAEENDAIYRTYLSWKSIKRSLSSNSFADEATINKLEVHYRFLSAFVHPVSDVTDLIYGRNQFDLPIYDHYSSELVLLYSIVLAVEELRHFREMTQRKPLVGLRKWESTEELCQQAWEHASHLWFPGHSPHLYDRINEANRRAFRMLRTSGAQRQIEDPSTIPETEIGYYRDPMRRLIGLHSGFHELMTGLAFVSPWPRKDAQFR
jgi:hypothetical protein